MLLEYVMRSSNDTLLCLFALYAITSKVDYQKYPE